MKRLLLTAVAVLTLIGGVRCAQSAGPRISETKITIATKEKKSDAKSVDRKHKAVLLENKYLKVYVMPQIGGRVYRAIFKPTGKDLFFWNKLLTKDDVHNFSGLTFNFPQLEHAMGYVPWKYKKSTKAALRQAQGDVSSSKVGEVTISQWYVIDENFPVVYAWFDKKGYKGPTFKITEDISLEAGRSYIKIHTRLENLTDQERVLQYWLNSLHDTLDNTEFLIFTEWMIGHGGGFTFKNGRRLPATWEDAFSWPVHRGIDLSRQKNWNAANGMFAVDYQYDYTGVYHHDKQRGVVRVFPHKICKGVKLWTFGRQTPDKKLSFTHGPLLNELWCGLTRNFNESRIIRPHEVIEWTEYWYPIVGTGGFDKANKDAAVKLSWRKQKSGGAGVLDLWVAPTKVFIGANVKITMFKGEVYSGKFDMKPDAPWHGEIEVSADKFFFPVTVTISDAEGKEIITHRRNVSRSTIFWRGTQD
ncbi:MAG: DUF5107 domain-containing protein [Planctomycetia bacterium]|nr:DUF5107 domain-containing protein [Planctomycetia bacterium]